MDLKFKHYVLVDSANSKKFNMAVDQLADSEETELRIEQTTGCPIIMFKQPLFKNKSFSIPYCNQLNWHNHNFIL